MISVFTDAELAYLTAMRLGRLATVDATGAPHVVPVGFHYNAELDAIDVTGWGLGHSKKYRDAQATGRVAFVVDDAPGPGAQRGVEIRGAAEIWAVGGSLIRPGADPEFIRIIPARVISWGLDTGPFEPRGRDVR